MRTLTQCELTIVTAGINSREDYDRKKSQQQVGPGEQVAIGVIVHFVIKAIEMALGTIFDRRKEDKKDGRDGRSFAPF